MLRGKVNKVGFEEVKQLKNEKPDVNALNDLFLYLCTYI